MDQIVPYGVSMDSLEYFEPSIKARFALKHIYIPTFVVENCLQKYSI